jgi:hypothetical protein
MSSLANIHTQLHSSEFCTFRDLKIRFFFAFYGASGKTTIMESILI